MILIQLLLVVSIIVTETKCFFFNANVSLSRWFVNVVVLLWNYPYREHTKRILLGDSHEQIKIRDKILTQVNCKSPIDSSGMRMCGERMHSDTRAY